MGQMFYYLMNHSALDRNGGRSTNGYAELAQSGMTIVIVIMKWALLVRWRIVSSFMADGVVVEDGTPEQVFEQTQN